MTAEILLVCLSQKPAVGEEHKSSAARQLLKVVALALADHDIPFDLFDIREQPFPFFDGRQPADCPDPVSDVCERIRGSRHLIVSVPAYWSGMSGVAKNFFDVLGGAAYDAAERTSVFAGKQVLGIVVGGAAGDAHAASVQLDATLRDLGADGLGRVVQLDDPRRITDMDPYVQECYRLPAALVPAGPS